MPPGWFIIPMAGLLGWLTSRRVLGERCPLAATVSGLALGVVFLLLGTCYLFRWLGLTDSLWLLAGGFLLLCLALRRTPAPPLSRLRLHPGAVVYLLGGSLVVLFYSLFGQNAWMMWDQDFFIHAGNIGLFLNDHFPPRNPFLDVPMHGHFGRDLLIAIFSRLTGAPFLKTEWLYTSGLQLGTFLLLFAWLRSVTGSALQAGLGSGFGFFAVNVGSKAGFVDTLENNNPTAVFFLVVVSWAVFRAIQENTVPALVVAGLCLGTDAVVYETHFGLMMLALAGLLAARHRWRERPFGEALRQGAWLWALGAAVALTAGGVFSELGSRLLGDRAPIESGYAQRVTVRFPKPNPFCVRVTNLRPSRPFETRLRSWKADFRTLAADVPLWHSKVVNFFWYPTWMLPLTLGFLIARRHAAGLWWGSLGVLGLLIPSMVHFGVYEAETTRWFFVTAAGAAIAFGLSLALLLEHSRGKARWAAALFCAAALWFNQPSLHLALEEAQASLKTPGTVFPDGRPGLRAGVPGLVPDWEFLLQSFFGIAPGELSAADWLRAHADPADRFLADDGGSSHNCRGARLGLIGLFPAMVAAPSEGSSSNSGYPQELQARLFWATGDGDLLGSPLWIYARVDEHPPEFWRRLDARFQLAFENDAVRVYRFRGGNRFPPSVPREPAVSLELGELPAHGSAGEACRIAARAANPAGEAVQGTAWVELRFRPLFETDWVAEHNLLRLPVCLALAPGQSEAIELLIVLPDEPGDYAVGWRRFPLGDWTEAGNLRLAAVGR